MILKTCLGDTGAQIAFNVFVLTWGVEVQTLSRNHRATEEKNLPTQEESENGIVRLYDSDGQINLSQSWTDNPDNREQNTTATVVKRSC